MEEGTLSPILGKSIFVTLDDEICYGHKNTTGISLFWVIMVDKIDKKGFEILSIDRIVGMGNSTLHHFFEKIVGNRQLSTSKKNPASPGTLADRQ